MSADAPRRGLGRGLSALLGEVSAEQPIAPGADRSDGIRMIQVAVISPNHEQPRRHFDEEKLAELAESIAARGVIQPILLRPHPQGSGYQIIAGERRWRAAQRARLHEVPAIVRDLNDADTLELAIVENVQRHDLNAIEEALAYQRLIDEFGHGQESIGKLVGKSRSHVANLLRLLGLPDEVRAMLIDGRLDMGHARAVVTAYDPLALAQEVVARRLSVRETEKLARTMGPGGVAAKPSKSPSKGGGETNADVAALERQIGDILGLKVTIAHGDKGGTISIAYSTLDQLDLVCQRLSGEPI